MPVSGGGFEQSYNAQAGVDIETMLVITQHVTQACNDKREVVPTLQRIATLSAALGEVKTLIADNGFFSKANVRACHAGEIEPLLALKRESHHPPVLERFAADSPAPQTIDPVFGIIKREMGWRQISMRAWPRPKVNGAW